MCELDYKVNMTLTVTHKYKSTQTKLHMQFSITIVIRLSNLFRKRNRLNTVKCKLHVEIPDLALWLLRDT